MKRKILASSLARPYKEVESILQKAKVSFYSDKNILNNQTVYCLSPYKTGTTFLASGFDSKIASHEPMQYLSLKEFENDFNGFFIKRLNCLNLKLECSGFLSAYINEITTNSITKDLNYICILREPSKWINSLLNYWETLDFLNFDYINKLFWIEKVGVDLIEFRNKSGKEKKEDVDRLIDFYLSFTENTFKIKNIKHIKIQNLEKYMIVELSILIDEEVIKSKFFKRENKKSIVYENKLADIKYKQILIKNGL